MKGARKFPTFSQSVEFSCSFLGDVEVCFGQTIRLLGLATITKKQTPVMELPAVAQ